MVTQVTEVDGARVVIARMPSGKVRGAAVWESKKEPGKFHAAMRESANGKVEQAFHYEGSRIDFASEWAADYINKDDKP